MEPQQLRDEIALAQAGEAGGMESLIEAYGPRLYGYFLRATGSHHDAEDLLGELWLRIVKTIKSYDDRGKFEPWLFRIAANMVRDRIRRIKVNPGPASLSGGGDEGDASGSLADRLEGDAERADERLMATEAGQQLAAALGKLDPPTRQVILLRHFGELSFKEIADICGCPVGTALARMHRGLKTLRRVMGADHGTE